MQHTLSEPVKPGIMDINNDYYVIDICVWHVK